jgi:hypothetical protein
MDGGAHMIIVVISSTKTSNNYEIVCMYNARSFIEKKILKIIDVLELMMFLT